MTAAILPFLFILTSALAPPAAVPADVTLDREFELRSGRSVRIEGERLTVTFNRVVEDSRCPQGVQCVWAGNAKVMLRLSKARRRASTMSLNTGLDPKQAAYRGYEVRLVKLDPYPKEGKTIRKRDYVATLVVSRAGSGGADNLIQ
ncbi:MAG TPA: hypothetical protein VJ715_21050 [Pyrinomonadaceae bacterium]|nr:hypothetical protein [Pyrinomonadaceae bacterium]